MEINNNSDEKVTNILESYKEGLKEATKYRVVGTSGENGVYNTDTYGEYDNEEQAEDRCAELRTQNGINAHVEVISLKEAKPTDFEYIGRDDWGRHIIKSKDTGTYFGDINLTKAGKERDLSHAAWYTYSSNDPYDGEPEASMKDDIIVNIVNPEDIPTDYQREEYELLYRLKSDCDYFLGNGEGYEGHLWAKTIDAQIAKMRELYDQLEEKPEWLTSEDIDRYESEMKNYNKEGLNESAKGPNYVDAYLDLALSMNDGLGEVQDNIEWAKTMAQDYGVKYDEDEGIDTYNLDLILRKALTIQFKKDPEAFKEGVENFIQYGCLESDDFNYLYTKIHNDSGLLTDLTVLLDYLNKNNGDPKVIEGIEKALGNISTIAVNARQIGDELCDYLNDSKIWKYLGTSVRFWTSNEIEYMPKGYTCMVGEYFNLLLFKKSSEIQGIALLFKDSKEEVVAELFTYGWNKETEEKHRVITMDNFKPLGTSFIITAENKEPVFKQIFKKFKDTINKLKVEYMETEEEFCKYWDETKEKYESEKKKYLSGIRMKESVNLKEAAMSDQEVYKVVLGWYKQQIEAGKMTLNQCYELLSDKAKVSLNKMIDQSKIKESLVSDTINKLIKESIELNKKN